MASESSFFLATYQPGIYDDRSGSQAGVPATQADFVSVSEKMRTPEGRKGRKTRRLRSPLQEMDEGMGYNTSDEEEPELLTTPEGLGLCRRHLLTQAEAQHSQSNP
jgi:hypothetical protein